MKSPVYTQELGYRYGNGTLAFFDTYASGLVPVKVEQIPAGGPFVGWLCHPSENFIRCKVTANRGAYRRGETLLLAPRFCVPRSHVYTRGGSYRIATNYSFEG